MRNNHFPHLLLGSKLRYDRQQRINESVEDQSSFDELFNSIFHHEKLVAQRAMRAITVLIKKRPEFIQVHTERLLTVLRSPDYKEIKSYVVQLLPKLKLTSGELDRVRHMLTYMALNANEQKTIRTQALQSLYEFGQQHPDFADELHEILTALAHERTPSIQLKVLKLCELLKPAKVPA